MKLNKYLILNSFFEDKTVSLDVGKLIQKGRVEKEWTQKDLATVCAF